MKILNGEGYLVDHNIEPEIGNPKQSIILNGDLAQIEEYRYSNELLRDRRSRYQHLRSVLEECMKTNFDTLDSEHLYELLLGLHRVYADFLHFPHSRIIDIFDRDRPYGIEITNLIVRFLPYWKQLSELNMEYALFPHHIQDFWDKYEQLWNYFFPESDVMDPIVVETEM